MADTDGPTPAAIDAARSALLRLALAQPGAHRDEPWPDDTVVKVGDKVFVFLGPDGRPTVGLKCGRDRAEADLWLQDHPGVASPSRYVGRFGWNAVRVAEVPLAELEQLLVASYERVASRVPRSRR